MLRTFESQKNVNTESSCFRCKKLTSVYNELTEAVERNDVNTVSHILNCSYDLKTSKQEHDQTLTHRVFKEFNHAFKTQRQMIEMLELLLDKGVDVNAKDNKERTLLHLAIEHRKTQVIDFLLERQANMHVRNSLGNSLAHHLIEWECRKSNNARGSSPDPRGKLRPNQKDSADFIWWMVLKGFDFDCQNKNGDTALHLAANYNLLHAVSVLLRRTKNAKICNNGGMTAFQLFAINAAKDESKLDYHLYHTETYDVVTRRWYLDRTQSETKAVRVLTSNYSAAFVDEIFMKFLSKGFSENFTDESGSTPVHYALNLDRPKIVKCMLKEFINVHARDENGNTVLHLVINHLCGNKCRFVQEYKEIARDFWSKGANIYAINKHGFSPLSVAMKSGKVHLLAMFVEYGAIFNRKRRQANLLLKFFLIKKEKFMESDKSVLGDRRNRNSKKTEGCEKHQAIFDLIIKEGWEVNKRDSNGTTLLHVAAHFKDNGDQLVQKLIQRGAHIDFMDDNGCLPLHTAIFHENFQATRTLLMYGADINENTHLLNVDHLKRIPGTVSFAHFINEGPIAKKFPLDRHKQESIPFFLLEHLITLQAAELPIDEKLMCILPSERQHYSWIYKQCICEIKSLKAYKLANNMSVYDLLHINRNSTRISEINEKLRKLISCPKNLEHYFPLYHIIVSGVYYVAVQRKEMLEPAKDALTMLTSTRMPELCLHEIFRYLNNVSLRCLIEAVKGSK